MKHKPEQVAVVGGGLVGSLLSIFLARKGMDVTLFERRPDPRSHSAYQGRSINLALSDRGWRALAAVGADAEVRNLAIPMYRRVLHREDGSLGYQDYGKEGQAIYSVSRGGLNRALLSLAEAEARVRVHFGQRCVDADLERGRLVFEDAETSRLEQHFDAVFGADGAFSALRSEMLRSDRFNYQQEYIEHGYKELSIPAKAEGGFQMEREALHIWPRGSHMLIALPNPDGSFTCTLFFAFEGKDSFSELDTPAKARAYFEQHFSDALALMPDFDTEWAENPVSALCIIRCYPWVKGKVALIGDAAHAIVPFYGQGMNAGFEDCYELDRILSEHTDWHEALDAYQRDRKPNGDAIADLALNNFIEMRDRTADPRFLLQKRIEARFNDRHPTLWTPLYSMVTFSEMPYSEALRRGKIQEEIMESVMNRSDIEALWDSPEVEAAILEACVRAFGHG